MLSVYHDATSPLHRLPAWVKLAALFAAGVGVVLVRDLRVLVLVLVVVVGGYAVARIPWRSAARQVTATLPFLAAIAVAQVLVGGATAAAVVTTRLVVLLLLAGLVTLTTRTEAMVAVIEALLRPLVPLGVRPERVGMVVMMTIRFVPVIKEQADAVRAAQRARGVERSVVFLVPLLVRTLRMADQLAEALDARGADANDPSGSEEQRSAYP